LLTDAARPELGRRQNAATVNSAPGKSSLFPGMQQRRSPSPARGVSRGPGGRLNCPRFVGLSLLAQTIAAALFWALDDRAALSRTFWIQDTMRGNENASDGDTTINRIKLTATLGYVHESPASWAKTKMGHAGTCGAETLSLGSCAACRILFSRQPPRGNPSWQKASLDGRTSPNNSRHKARGVEGPPPWAGIVRFGCQKTFFAWQTALPSPRR